VIDARLPKGEITLAKLNPDFRRITVLEGELTGYVQYPGSDCLNGAVLKVADGHRLMQNISSHHYLLTTGHNRVDIEMIAGIFDLQVEVL
jgi:L-fucose isomerase-like protein